MRLTFLLVMLCYGLSAQEQVSDIDNYGVTYPTSLIGLLEFAKVNDDQYLIEEDDSTTIYRLIDTSFEKIHVFKNSYPENLKILTSSEFYSDIVVVDDKYIKVTSKTLEVFNIETGERIYNADYRPFQISFNKVLDIANQRVVLSATRFGVEKLLYFDLEINKFTYLPDYFLGVEKVFDEDRIVYINHNSNVVGSWSMIDRSITRLHISTEKISMMSLTPSKENVFVVEESGTVFKIDENNVSTELSCRIPDLSRLEALHFLNDRYIKISKSGSSYFEDSHKIEVVNVDNCSTENSFATHDLYDHVRGPMVTDDRNGNESYTIISYNGGNYSGNGNFIVNHQDKTYTSFRIADEVITKSPFIYEDAIYFETFNINDIAFNTRAIAKHDLVTKETNFLHESGKTYGQYLSSVLGYPQDGNIIVATNTSEENIKAWSIDIDDNFSELLSLEYGDRLGFYRVQNVKAFEGSIYVSSFKDVHRVSNDTKPLSEIYNYYSIYPSGIQVDFSTAPGVVAYANKYKDEDMKIYRIESSTGRCDTINAEQYIESYHQTIGPLIFTLNNFYDIRTNDFGTLDLPGAISSFVVNDDSAIVSYIRDNGTFGLSILDFNNMQIDTMPVTLGYTKFYRAYDGYVYAVSKPLNFPDSEILLLNSDGDFESIYYGKFHKINLRSYGYVGEAGSHLEFHDSDNDRNVVISNKSDQVFISGYGETSFSKSIILASTQDGYVINGDNRIEFNKINYGKTIVHNFNSGELLTGIYIFDNRLLYSISETIGNDTYNKIGVFNLNTLQTESYEDITSIEPCGPISIKAKLSDSKFIAWCSDSINGYEPRLLDIEKSEINLLKDINPGMESSSYPYQPVYSTENYYYFTATIADGSTQWFRLDKSNYNITSEEEEEDSKRLTVVPTISNTSVCIDEDIDKLTIVNATGEIIKTIDAYKKDQEIDISAYNDGLHYVIKYDESTGEYTRGSFVKMK